MIDTSAIIAMILREAEAPALRAAMEADPRRFLSIVSFVEAAIVIEGRLADVGGHELDLWLQRAQVELVPVDVEQAEAARAAYRHYGKGRHPAALNFGDCFAYALATVRREPLLYKGGDFSRTDVISALRGA